MSEEKEKCSYCHGSGRSPFASDSPSSPFSGSCYLCGGNGLAKESQPSAMTDPLEQVKEKVSRAIRDYPTGIDENPEVYYKCALALEAILAMPMKPIDKNAIGHDVGYNSCLSEVHAIIAGKVGGR